MFKTIIKKIFNKIVYTYNRVTGNLRNYKVRFLYNTKNKVTVYKDVHLDNPKIVFGNDVALLYGVHIFGDGEVNIGNNVCIGKDTIIYSTLDNGGVTIGNDTMIAGQCYIIDSDHGIDKDEVMRKQPLSTEKIVIGNDVWIAAGCKILKGINIGDGAVIGANAVVTKDIEPYSINVGVPARKIGYRK